MNVAPVEPGIERTGRSPFPALTGLRFLGALAIFMSHALSAFSPDRPKIVFGSVSAVGLFFVLSGFILTRNYGDRMEQIGVRGFWLSRFARLWPLHIVCLALVIWLRPDRAWQTESFWPKLLLHVTLTHNWVPVFNWLLGFNGVAWFVATEVFFCLMFPWLARWRGWSFVLLWAGVLALHLGLLSGLDVIAGRWPELTRTTWLVIQANPLLRLLEFCTGMGTAMLYERGWRLREGRRAPCWHAIIELAVLALFWSMLRHAPVGDWMARQASGSGFRSLATWMGKGGSTMLASALLILVLATSQGPLARMLCRPALLFLGRMSYALFLVHPIVLVLVWHYCAESVSPVMMIAGALGISLGAAALLHLLVERPMRDLVLRLAGAGKGDGREASFNFAPFRKLIGPSAVAVGTGLVGWVALWADRAGFLENVRDRQFALRPPIAVAEPVQPAVEFAGEARLVHFEAISRADGIELLMVWKGIPGGSRNRFIHLVGQDGQIVRQIPPAKDLFRDRDWVVDRVPIPVAQLAGIVSIGIGFWSPEGGTVSVSHGPRGMAGRRLEVCTVRSGRVVEWLTDLAPPLALPEGSTAGATGSTAGATAQDSEATVGTGN